MRVIAYPDVSGIGTDHPYRNFQSPACWILLPRPHHLPVLVSVTYLALLSWKADETTEGCSGWRWLVGDGLSPFSEQYFTRALCAEILLHASAFVAPSVCDWLNRRASGYDADDPAAVNKTLRYACHFPHVSAAALAGH